MHPLQQRADHADAHQVTVVTLTAQGVAQARRQDPSTDRQPGQHHQAVGAEELAEPQDHLGDQWNRYAKVLKNRHELRHHIGQQQRQGTQYTHHQERRIDQRIDHLAAQQLAALQVVAELAQGAFQRPAGFTGAHHAQVQRGKRAALLLQRRRQRFASLDLVADTLDQGPHLGMTGLLEQQV